MLVVAINSFPAVKNVENPVGFILAFVPDVLIPENRNVGVYERITEVLLFLFINVENGERLNVNELKKQSPRYVLAFSTILTV